MKYLFTLAILLFCLHMQASVTLRHQGTATQLVVNGKPMLLLAGELSNSAATSIVRAHGTHQAGRCHGRVTYITINVLN